MAAFKGGYITRHYGMSRGVFTPSRWSWPAAATWMNRRCAGRGNLARPYGEARAPPLATTLVAVLSRLLRWAVDGPGEPPTKRCLMSRVIRAPNGSALSAKSWLTEAPLRMLMNNLDPDVAERPEDLVVYGGIGQGRARLGIVRSHCRDADRARRRRDAARAVGQAGRCIPHARRCPARADRQLQPGAALGDLGALQRARSQGPDDVRADDGRLLDLHRQPGHRAGHLSRRSSRWDASTTAATSPAAGCSPPVSAAWAARSRWRLSMAGASCLAVECQQSRIDMRLRTGYSTQRADRLSTRRWR